MENSKDTKQLFTNKTADGDSAEFTANASDLNKRNNQVTIFTYGTSDTETITLKAKPETTLEEPSQTLVALNDKSGSPIILPVNSKIILELSKGTYVASITGVAGGSTDVSMQVIYD